MHLQFLLKDSMRFIDVIIWTVFYAPASHGQVQSDSFGRENENSLINEGGLISPWIAGYNIFFRQKNVLFLCIVSFYLDTVSLMLF